MDTVPRRRQGAVSGEPDLEEAANELAYSAALSQADGKATNPDTMPSREAAPGTFESGKGSGKSYEPEQMPTTNPLSLGKGQIRSSAAKKQTFDS